MSVLRSIGPLCIAIYLSKLGTDAVFDKIEIGNVAAKSALEATVLVAIMLPLLAFFYAPSRPDSKARKRSSTQRRSWRCINMRLIRP